MVVCVRFYFYISQIRLYMQFDVLSFHLKVFNKFLLFQIQILYQTIKLPPPIFLIVSIFISKVYCLQITIKNKKLIGNIKNITKFFIFPIDYC